jgi:hypothetical protein
MRPELIQMIATTYEVCGATELSDAAQEIVVNALSSYPEESIFEALERCCKEVKGRLALADIIQRIRDEHPGPQEAWAIVQGALENEDITVVWTEEISKAFFAVYNFDDKIAARKAFLESYEKELLDSRSKNKPVKWTVSAGSDPNQRERAVIEAAQKGRLLPEQARKIVPSLPMERLGQLPGKKVKQLPPSKEPEYLSADEVKKLTSQLISKIGIEDE